METIHFPFKHHSTRDEVYAIQRNLQYCKHDKIPEQDREAEGPTEVSTRVKTRQKDAQTIKLYGRFTKQEYAHNLKIK